MKDAETYVHQLGVLFNSETGETAEEIVPLVGAGSNRLYYRLKGKTTTRIGTVGTTPEENRAFIFLSQAFLQRDLPVPKVTAVSDDAMCYLQEDLGDITLYASLAESRANKKFSADDTSLLQRTISMLPDFQFKDLDTLDFSKCYPVADFDRRSIMWDLNYFKYCFLKPFGVEFHEGKLEDAFISFSDVLRADQVTGFMLRDFQSRNVMVHDGNPYLIDFQGGRRGPFYYDVASFLWQARAAYTPELRSRLAETYRHALQKYVTVDSATFYARLKHFVLFRMLQVLGAYGFRGYFERKPHFIDSVPPALANLKAHLQQGFTEYPYLINLLRGMTENLRIATKGKDDKRKKQTVQKNVLTVHVYSFAYKYGIPEDKSGNGGGFVFDCRYVRNPGKYPIYQKITGLDAKVIRFFEVDGGMEPFLKHAESLVDAAVKKYVQRDFTDLTVCFGCTGGQHRSVYAAQMMAKHLQKKFHVRVHLVHRELNTETNLRLT